jgi:hypothetical protein
VSVDLWLTSNSPGEVATWVGTVAPALARLRPEWRQRLALVPCPYASGAEKRVAEQIEGLQEVLSPWETTRWYFGARRLAWPRAPRGLVMFLGGDPWHALLLKARLGYPAAGYFERPNGWCRYFDRAATVLPWEGADCLGDLMVDHVRWNEESPEVPTIALFPGSRPWQLRLCLTPLLYLAEHFPRPVNWVLMQSPFVSPEQLQWAIDRPLQLGLPSARGQVEGPVLRLASGKTIELRRGGQGMQGLSMAVTLPGTNTAELACAGVPFVVPLHPLAYIGGGGLSGLLERLPLPSAWKVASRQRKHRRLRFTALPNQRAGRAVVPEILLSKSVDPLRDQLLQWLEEPAEVERIRADFRGLMGPPGASTRLAEWMIELVERG